MAYISINKHVILRNIKREEGSEPEPVIAVRDKKSSKPKYGNRVAIVDKDGNTVALFDYDADKPILKCGARLVCFTDYEVKILD